jgi:hypothetical protein
MLAPAAIAAELAETKNVRQMTKTTNKRVRITLKWYMRNLSFKNADAFVNLCF